MIGRRKFFGMLGGAAAAISATWSAPKRDAAVTLYDVADVNLERLPAGPQLIMTRPPDRVLVCQSEFWFGDEPVIYYPDFVHLDRAGKWHIFADDPNFRGRAVKYQATMDPSEVFAKNGRIFFGSFTRPV